MKNYTFIIIMSFIMASGFSQTAPNNEFTKEYYLQKSKNQDTIAWILLGVGSAITIGGLISMNESSKNDSWGFPDDSSSNITLVGTVIGSLSFPFFLSSAKNARKAANISLNNQTILLPQQNNIAQNYNPSISFQINF
jgi:hypothetical protein